MEEYRYKEGEKSGNIGKDREAYIEYALDMVIHNLVSSGQLDASKSYLLKTEEMKAHIGRMSDRLRKETTHLSNGVKKPNWQSRGSTKEKGRSKPLSSYGKGKSPLHNSTRPQPQPSAGEEKKMAQSIKSGMVDGTLPMTHVPSMNPKNNIKGYPVQQPLKASAQAFGAKLDFRGFANTEISLDMDGRKLTVTGIRSKRDGLNARKATETIEIPQGINVESLKIARRMDGILVIEETVLETESIL